MLLVTPACSRYGLCWAGNSESHAQNVGVSNGEQESGSTLFAHCTRSFQRWPGSVKDGARQAKATFAAELQANNPSSAIFFSASVATGDSLLCCTLKILGQPCAQHATPTIRSPKTLSNPGWASACRKPVKRARRRTAVPRLSTFGSRTRARLLQAILCRHSGQNFAYTGSRQTLTDVWHRERQERR